MGHSMSFGGNLLAQSVGGKERDLPAEVVEPKPGIWNWERWDDFWRGSAGDRTGLCSLELSELSGLSIFLDDVLVSGALMVAALPAVLA